MSFELYFVYWVGLCCMVCNCLYYFYTGALEMGWTFSKNGCQSQQNVSFWAAWEKKKSWSPQAQMAGLSGQQYQKDWRPELESGSIGSRLMARHPIVSRDLTLVVAPRKMMMMMILASLYISVNGLMCKRPVL